LFASSEGPPEKHLASPKLALHGVHGHPADAGDLRIGKIVHISEQEDRPRLGRDAEKRGFDK
jgi:hypothetical protein